MTFDELCSRGIALTKSCRGSPESIPIIRKFLIAVPSLSSMAGFCNSPASGSKGISTISTADDVILLVCDDDIAQGALVSYLRLYQRTHCFKAHYHLRIDYSARSRRDPLFSLERTLEIHSASVIAHAQDVTHFSALSARSIYTAISVIAHAQEPDPLSLSARSIYTAISVIAHAQEPDPLSLSARSIYTATSVIAHAQERDPLSLSARSIYSHLGHSARSRT